MSLSYTLRLLCLLLVVAGLAQAAAQIVLALGAGSVLRRLKHAPARRQERILYLLQIGPALLGIFVGVVLFLPAYLHSEPQRGVETVSLVCMLIAAGMALWFAFALLRGLRITLRTVRFARGCRRSGEAFAEDGDVPVLCVRDVGLPAALVGLFRPLIIVSAEFASRADRLDSAALALALAHERAHVVHRDNWKLLSVAFLPRLDQFLPGGVRWIEHWQRAADWAADDDAVQGDPARSLLLAEVLVWAARCARGPRPPAVCTALTSAEAGLAARIERLTHPPYDSRRDSNSIPAWLPVFMLLAGTALAPSPWIYALSEWLLHLGAA